MLIYPSMPTVGVQKHLITVNSTTQAVHENMRQRGTLKEGEKSVLAAHTSKMSSKLTAEAHKHLIRSLPGMNHKINFKHFGG
jgi:hypothetical protein